MLPGLFFWGASLVALRVKNLPAMWRPRFDPWSGRFPGEGNGNPLQYSCLENPLDRGAWWEAHRDQSMGSQKNQIWLSDNPFTLTFQSRTSFLFPASGGHLHSLVCHPFRVHFQQCCISLTLLPWSCLPPTLTSAKEGSSENPNN